MTLTISTLSSHTFEFRWWHNRMWIKSACSIFMSMDISSLCKVIWFQFWLIPFECIAASIKFILWLWTEVCLVTHKTLNTLHEVINMLRTHSTSISSNLDVHSSCFSYNVRQQHSRVLNDWCTIPGILSSVNIHRLAKTISHFWCTILRDKKKNINEMYENGQLNQAHRNMPFKT